MPENQNSKTFQVGDTVTWTSQAGGNAKTKTGKVTWIIPAGCLAGSYQLVEQGFSTHRCQGRERDHESYLIQVGKSKRLYWPLVKYLEKPALSPLEAYKQRVEGHKREAEHRNADLEDDDLMMSGEGCGYDAVDVGDESNTEE